MIRIPLLKDNHNHLFTYSAINNAVKLFNITDKTSAVKLLKSLPENNLNVAIGWFDNYYIFSEKELENLPPVIIVHNSLHKYLFNSKASIIISKDYEEWAINNNNQIWVEKNIMKILSYISQLTNFNEEILNRTIKDNYKKGVCFASDMFVTNPDIFNFLKNKDFNSFTEIWTEPYFYTALPENLKKICKGVKIFTDGALGACSAAISDYKNSWNPVLSYSDFELNEILEKIITLNVELSIHAIGDIAIDQVLNSLKNIRRQNFTIPIRLEHVQFISKKQAQTAKDLGLVLSMQPNFNMDSVIYNDRLTQNFCERNNPFRMLIDDIGFIPGEDLIFGSDGMPTGIDGVIQQSIFPPVSGQKISIEEFINAYCINNMDKGYIDLEIDILKKKIISKTTIIY